MQYLRTKLITTIFVVLLGMYSLFAQNFTEHSGHNLLPVYKGQLIAVDINADGKMDVIQTGIGDVQQYFKIFLNNGNFTFSSISPLSTYLSYTNAACADVDNDGDIDIAVCGIDNANVYHTYIGLNNGDSTFSWQSYNLPGISFGGLYFADFDGDGKIDLFLCGINQSGQRISQIYRNTGLGFEASTLLKGFSSCKAAVFDYNNDGRCDILITGLDENVQKKTCLYVNEGNFQFSEVNTGFDAITSGNIAVADVDANGWVDVIMTGYNQENKRVCKLYRNLSGTFLEQFLAFSDSLSGSDVTVADINNDGKPDVIFAGCDNQLFYRTVMYINAGNGNFVRNTSLTMPLTDAALLLVDLNNDYKIDLVATGRDYSNKVCKVFENTISSTNTPPPAPSGTSSHPINYNTMYLSWLPVSDAEQGSTAIQYNVYVGSDRNSGNIYSPQSTITTGKRLLLQNGNAYHLSNFSVQHLSEGKYYWAVQAIDNNHNASTFSPPDSFVICSPVSAGNDTIICQGDTATLKVKPGTYSCNWYSSKNGLIANHTYTIHYAPSQTDTVILETQHQLGCVLYDTIIVRVINPLSIQLPSDTAGCVGNSLRLTLNNGFSMASWSSSLHGFIHNDSLAYWHNITGNDTIWVSVVDTNRCKNTDTVIVHPYPLPNFSLGADKYVCQFDSILLQAPDTFNQVAWYNFSQTLLLANTPSYRTQIIQNDSILLKVTDRNGCSTTDTLIIYMLPLPAIYLGADTSICFGDSVLFHPYSTSTHIDWYSSHSGWLAMDTSLLFYQILSNDTLIVRATDNNHCINTDTLYIQVLPLPVFSLGSDTAICFGQNVMFSTGPGWKQVNWFKSDSGLWQTNSWFISYTPSKTDTLVAQVTNQFGCHQTDTVCVVVHPLPAVWAGNDTSLCMGDTLLRSVNEPFPYIEWRTSQMQWISYDNLLRLPITASDTLVLTVSDIHQCVNSDTALIKMLPLPVIPFTSDTAACWGDTLHLILPGKWQKVHWKSQLSFLTTDSSHFPYPALYNDTISLLLTDTLGCSSRKTVAVKVNRLPIIQLSDTSVCQNQCVTFTLHDTLVTYVQWLLPDNQIIESSHPALTYCPKASSTLKVTAYTKASCRTSHSVKVGVYPLPVVQLGNDTAVCYGTKLPLASLPGFWVPDNITQFEWSPVDTAQMHQQNPLVTLTRDTFFTLTLTDTHGCINSDTIAIAVNPPSHFTLPDTLWICKGQSISLPHQPIISGSRYPYHFEWSPDSGITHINSGNPLFNPLNTTTYRLVASSWLCKPDTTYITLAVHPLPTIYHTPNITIGKNSFVQLYAEGGIAYEWWPANSLNQSNIPNPIARPEVTTTYTVRVTDTFGCVNYDTLTVFVENQIFIPDLFSPNNDGKNDTFKVYGFGVLQLSLIISDMQNNIVFQSSDLKTIMDIGWDGTYRGKPLPATVYRWHISGKFINGETILYRGKNTGTVVLIR